MKIGILTFHKAYNYGAYMQCYSLSTYLKRELPEHTIEVIDFSSQNMISDYQKSFWQRVIGSSRVNGSKPIILIAKRLVKELLHCRVNSKRRNYNKNIQTHFQEAWKHISLSNGRLVSDDSLQFKEFVDSQNYDVIIVGSDAVWNDNQTSWPNMYLLHDIKGIKKFSYAASTYGMDFSARSEERIQYTNDSLSEFEFIGVRDTVSEEYVLKNTGKSKLPVHTCDPSLLLDLDTLPVDMCALKGKLTQKGIDLTRPIIGFMCSAWLAKEVREKLGEEYQYVSVFHYNGYEDAFLDFLTPFEFSRVFSLFTTTFTHYFHGTMFSIKNGTRTYSIEKNSQYKKRYITKIQDTLTRTGLYEECYRDFETLDYEAWQNIRKEIKDNNSFETGTRYQKAIQMEKESCKPFITALKEVVKDG